MEHKKAVKICQKDAEIIVLSQRVNYKLVDPTTVGSKYLTFGMVIVESRGTCEPGHSHNDQEEIFFCISGKGIVIADDDHKEIPIAPKEAVFFPVGVYHSIKNPYDIPLEALWIISPAGWIFDKNPEMKKQAEKGMKIP